MMPSMLQAGYCALFPVGSHGQGRCFFSLAVHWCWLESSFSLPTTGQRWGNLSIFGLIESGIIVCIVGSHLRGRTRLGGKVLLLGGAVLVGVFLAVYGQIYQTGADAYGLFIIWAVLILGWVIVSEFAALWLVWLILLNTGAILYWQQVGYPSRQISFEYLCLGLAILNGAALAFREVGVLRGLEWLSGRWLRGILLIASLVALSLPTINWIVDFNLPLPKGVDVIVPFIWPFAAVGGYALYRLKLRDMISLALIVMNVCIILLTFIGEALLDNKSFDEAGASLFFALIILGVVSGAAFWLRKTAATMANETKESGI